MTPDEGFEAATILAQKLPPQPNHVLLDLYGLYKQATSGDVPDGRPGPFDPRGRAKYDAWARRRGMSREEAARSYVELVRSLEA